MESKIASSCPYMTLREREVLNATQLGLLIPPLPSIFQSSATQVLTKTECPLETLQILADWVSAIDNLYKSLLSTIRYDNSLTEMFFVWIRSSISRIR
jgi:hypothetical protein